MGQFDGKVAIVTGAASGIGRASAQRFAAEGAKVVVADVDATWGAQTVASITEAGGEAIFSSTDVSDPAQVEAMVELAISTYGRLDLAHNNAGIIQEHAPVADLSIEEWNRGIGVMLTGVFLCMKFEIPKILEQGGGAIVNTSSGAGIIGFPGAAPYVSAKHGVIGLTKTAALEYTTKNVRINCICPGTARTRMVDEWIAGSAENEAMVAGLHPIGRIAEPEEIAAAAIWLCSDDASFMCGHALAIDGGYTIQ